MSIKVAHLTTVDLSLRYLVLPQLTAIIDLDNEAIGISAPGPYISELTDRNVRHIPLASSTRGFSLRHDLKAAKDLWGILRREKIEILHTHNPKPGLYGRILGRLAGVPIVVNTVHGLYATPDDPWPKRILVYLVEAVASWFSDAELVQSSEDLALMKRLPGFSRRKAHFLGNGVDLRRFGPGGSPGHDRAAVRAKLGLGEDEIAVGAVGRLVEEKGYLELFAAARTLGPKFVVLAIGPDDPEKADSLSSAAIAEAQKHGVRFLGMRTDVDDLYRALDIFVLPSHREGFPRSAMEAAASGLPVIATDIRGCREVVVDGVNGLLVPVRQPVGLGEAISRLGADRELRIQMGKEGVARARAYFDENQIVATVLDTYRRVARRKGLVEVGEALRGAAASVEIRLAASIDAPALARLHRDGITSGFLSQLGSPFLGQLYEALISWPEASVLVADAGSGPVGFVVGVVDTPKFYRSFVRRKGVQAAVRAIPALLSRASLQRVWETFAYGRSTPGGNSSELLSMAVAENWRGKGLGHRLGQALLAVPQFDKGMQVVVGADNAAAIASYRKLGFDGGRAIEIHPGTPSLVLTWHP